MAVLCFVFYKYRIQPFLDEVGYEIVNETITNAENIRNGAADDVLKGLHEHLMKEGRIEESVDNMMISDEGKEAIMESLNEYRSKHP